MASLLSSCCGRSPLSVAINLTCTSQTSKLICESSNTSKRSQFLLLFHLCRHTTAGQCLHSQVHLGCLRRRVYAIKNTQKAQQILQVFVRYRQSTSCYLKYQPLPPRFTRFGYIIYFFSPTTPSTRRRRGGDAEEEF